MSVTVEFFGIARRRAGIERLEVDATTLGDAYDRLSERLPGWSAACLKNGQLTNSFLANRNGQNFVTDRCEPLSDGDNLLILSADMGG